MWARTKLAFNTFFGKDKSAQVESLVGEGECTTPRSPIKDNEDPDILEHSQLPAATVSQSNGQETKLAASTPTKLTLSVILPIFCNSKFSAFTTAYP
jgi:hypothetical protein